MKSSKTKDSPIKENVSPVYSYDAARAKLAGDLKHYSLVGKLPEQKEIKSPFELLNTYFLFKHAGWHGLYMAPASAIHEMKINDATVITQESPHRVYQFNKGLAKEIFVDHDFKKICEEIGLEKISSQNEINPKTKAISMVEYVSASQLDILNTAITKSGGDFIIEKDYRYYVCAARDLMHTQTKIPIIELMRLAENSFIYVKFKENDNDDASDFIFRLRADSKLSGHLHLLKGMQVSVKEAAGEIYFKAGKLALYNNKSNNIRYGLDETKAAMTNVLMPTDVDKIDAELVDVQYISKKVSIKRGKIGIEEALQNYPQPFANLNYKKEKIDSPLSKIEEGSLPSSVSSTPRSKSPAESSQPVNLPSNNIILPALINASNIKNRKPLLPHKPKTPQIVNEQPRYERHKIHRIHSAQVRAIHTPQPSLKEDKSTPFSLPPITPIARKKTAHSHHSSTTNKAKKSSIAAKR